MIQIIILAGIALFLILRLRSVLGTRTGFEKPAEPVTPQIKGRKDDRGFEVIEGGTVDHDIADFIDVKSESGLALAAMKRLEPSFNVGKFATGAKQAYEMILMAFEHGDLDTLENLLSPEVYTSFASVVEDRRAKGWKVEANFVGIREVKLTKAELDARSNEADITIRFVGELSSFVMDANGQIVEGDKKAVRRQKDNWTFSRVMGSNNPNWVLVATGA
jgi:predicted lipid-binding transport protein (Tim44 family)